jgi:hypothetical protein
LRDADAHVSAAVSGLHDAIDQMVEMCFECLVATTCDRLEDIDGPRLRRDVKVLTRRDVAPTTRVVLKEPIENERVRHARWVCKNGARRTNGRDRGTRGR